MKTWIHLDKAVQNLIIDRIREAGVSEGLLDEFEAAARALIHWIPRPPKAPREDRTKNKSQYTRKGRPYSPEEVLSKVIMVPKIIAKHTVGSHKIDFDGDLINMASERLMTFKLKGLKCVNCGIEGVFFAKESTRGNKLETYHFNLYAFDNDGNEVLMTKDHVIPKYKGGQDRISNYDTMCGPCNWGKRMREEAAENKAVEEAQAK